MRKTPVIFVGLIAICWLSMQWGLFSPLTGAWGQDKSKSKASKKKGTTSVLDVKANEIQGNFIKSAEELANEYYELKEYDRARMLLKSIQALDPQRANLDGKLKRLDEDMINSNATEVEVNSAKPWESSAVLVSAGKPIRIKAEGPYKFVMNAQFGPAGVVAGKTPSPQELVGELPLGALIGVIIPAERPQDGKADDKKREKPFLIGDGCDYTSTKDGILYLRINAPPENKNTGKLKVEISGGLRIGKGA